MFRTQLRAPIFKAKCINYLANGFKTGKELKQIWNTSKTSVVTWELIFMLAYKKFVSIIHDYSYHRGEANGPVNV